jgi:hypothetical protein
MLYHKIDPETGLYIESVESEEKPEGFVEGNLPEATEHYTLAYVNDEWISVLKKEYEIINNSIKLKPEFQPPPLPVPSWQEDEGKE